ncbi:MAG: Nramp family divalent metal transporter, partial [Planctomycetota bacterium]
MSDFEETESQSPLHDDKADSSTTNEVATVPVDPPKTLGRILLSVGPGLIVAGSIVGSGELIATTKTGAEAGFSLLWLILIGCVIKVFAQIEFGRYALVSGKTTLKALDEVPGPRIKGRGNWLIWYWVLMWLASISQLGGIVGGVG